MPISYQDEKQLFNLMQDYVNTSRNSNDFIKNSNKRLELAGKIIRRISTIRYMSLSEAETYIDYKTGRFKPGEYMTYCVDEELQVLFKELEAVTTEVNKHPWKTKEEAITNAAEKQKKVKNMLSLIKEEVGVEGAKEVLNRVMNEARVQTGIK